MNKLLMKVDKFKNFGFTNFIINIKSSSLYHIFKKIRH